jgi:GT2 family glycosyltransferase
MDGPRRPIFEQGGFASAEVERMYQKHRVLTGFDERSSLQAVGGSSAQQEAQVIDKSSCVVVTVTYGDRRGLLRRALEAAFSQGVERAVVVSNGTAQDVRDYILACFGDRVHLVHLKRNFGSAVGFGEGMRAAAELGSQYILLLDDDNELQPGCLDALKSRYAALAHSFPSSLLAVLAFRPALSANVAAGVSLPVVNPSHAAFFGFDLKDLPFKILRRLAPRLLPREKRDVYRMIFAPYSGMFFHRDVVRTHGAPREDFVLYCDDTEFSYRITDGGGAIVLDKHALITDLDQSWNLKAFYPTTFDVWLRTEHELRLFYGLRNQAFFEKHYRSRGARRTLNRFVYLSLLALRALQLNRMGRFKFILATVRMGEKGLLGEDPRFKLSP